MIRGRDEPVLVGRADPIQAGRAFQPLKRPFGVIQPVGDETQGPAGLQDAGEGLGRLVLQQTALVVARLVPGVGKQDQHPIDRGVRQGVHHVARIVGVDADILQIAVLDMAQGRGHAVQEGFATDHQGVGPPRRLGRHMLAAAETDLQPDLGRLGHHRPGVQRPGLGIGHGDGGQQGVHQRRLTRLDRAGLDAAERPQRAVQMRVSVFGGQVGAHAPAVSGRAAKRLGGPSGEGGKPFDGADRTPFYDGRKARRAVASSGKGETMIGHHLRGVSLAAIMCAVLGLSACATTGQPSDQNAAAKPARDRTLDAGLDPATTLDPYPSTYRPLPRENFAVVGATVLTGTDRKIDNGVVVVTDGRIAAVGDASTPVPAGYKVVDARGRYVTPGVIDVHSHLGVYPSPGVSGMSDGNEATNPNTAQVWAEHSLWPQDPGFNTARAGGVTTMHILPGSANLFGGRGVTIRNVPSITMQGMKFPAAPYTVKMACGENPSRVYGGRNQSPATGMGNMAGYRAAFIAAREYKAKWDKWHETGEGTAPTRNLQNETLAGVLDGSILIQNHCYRADEMALMMDMAREFGYRISTFHHATEAYKLAPQLAQNGICAAMWTGWWGFKMEALDAIEENAALVDAQPGSCAVIHSDDALLTQRLNQEAAAALSAGRRAGLNISEEHAIGWFTSNAAKAIGIADQTGSLTPGLRADVVIWSADPFSIYARADQVFIDGALAFDRSNPAYQPTSDFELGQPGYGLTAANVREGAR